MLHTFLKVRSKKSYWQLPQSEIGCLLHMIRDHYYLKFIPGIILLHKTFNRFFYYPVFLIGSKDNYNALCFNMVCLSFFSFDKRGQSEKKIVSCE